MNDVQLPLETPAHTETEYFTDPRAAVDRLKELYDRSSRFLTDHFVHTLGGEQPKARYRAFYPEVRLTTTSHTKAIRGSPLGMSRCRAPMPRRSPGPTCSSTICANSWAC